MKTRSNKAGEVEGLTFGDPSPRRSRQSAGQRYPELDWDDGLPAVPVEKRAESPPPPPVSSREDTSEPEIVPVTTTTKRGMSPAEFTAGAGEVPGVLTWEAVRKGELPPHGDPGMPPSLAADVPVEFRFWKAANRDEALRVREALVESGLFAGENIRKVNGDLRRVTAEYVVRLFLSEEPPLDDTTPPTVPPARRPVEKAAALLLNEARVATLFDVDVTQALGIETILAKVGSLTGDWIVAAPDTAEVRKAIAGPAFRLPSRDDVIFVTNATLTDPDSVEWVTEDRTGEVLKFALAEGREVPVFKAKAEPDQRIVYGVVLEPDEVDSQGDTIDATTIEKAAHRFMEEYGTTGVQHREFVQGRLKILESSISPVDFKVGKAAVKAGTWLMKMRVVDNDLWEAAKKGQFTGFSIGGTAVRKPAKSS